jgi:sigma-B regulation protein RsbU (phosphoserine phosphatase)
MPAASAPDPNADDKLRDIQAIADAALSRLDADDLLEELLARVKAILHTDTSAVLLLDRSGRYLVATAASGLEEEVDQGVRIPVGRGFAGRIASERRPVIIDKVDHTKVLNPILLDKGIKSLLGVPLLVEGGVIGVMHVGSLTPRQFSQEDAALLHLAADRAAMAVQSVLARTDRAAAAALQSSLVPTAPPAVPGLQMAARYVPGRAVVGGDWYDVLTLPSGEVGVVVGDVAGSGLRAAVIMGRIRSVVRAYALESSDPAEVLSKVDAKFQYFEPGVMATVLYGVFDRSLDSLRVSSAGHLPPVIAIPGDYAAMADITADLMIGVTSGITRHVSTVEFPPGALLCFFTDGLVERRDRALDDGMAKLCGALTAGPPEDACAAAMGALVGGEAPGDDIALLAVWRVPGEWGAGAGEQGTGEPQAAPAA